VKLHMLKPPCPALVVLCFSERRNCTGEM
jgi:hypothetical protein